MIKRIFLFAATVFLTFGHCLAFSEKFKDVNSLDAKIQEDPRHQMNELILREKMAEITGTRADGEMTEVIYSPKGEMKPYTKTVVGLDWGESFHEDACTCIVFGDNNEIYFRDIVLRVASMGFGSYVKGEINGGVITVPVPQTLVDYGGYGREVALMEKDSSGEWIVSDIPEITYTYNENTGVIMSSLPGTPGQYAIGVKWTFDAIWNQIGDYVQVYTPYDGEFMTVPEGVTLEEYYYNDGYYAYPVEIGVDNDDLYIQGLSLASPSAVVKAKIDGNKGYIPQNELLGTVMGYFIWTKMMVPDPALGWALVPSDETYGLEIDLENKTIKSSDPSQILIFNCEYDRVFYLDGFNDFVLSVQTSYAGTPQNPFGVSFDGEDFRDYYGIFGFNFNLSNISQEGTVLDTSYLYYSIFIDGDIYDFEELEGLYGIMYPGVEGIVSEMPFDFINGYDIDATSNTGRFIGIYPDGVTTIGVQAIYKYDGKTTCSDIVTYNVDTDEITVSGVESVKSDEIADIRYYDFNGKEISHPDKGMYIVRIILKDGRMITKKIVKR